MATFHPDPGEERMRRQGIGALILVGLALLTLYLPAERQQQIAGFVRATLLRPFIATQEALARTRARGGEIDALRRELDSLTVTLMNQASLAEENRRLRQLLDLRERVGRGYTSARLLRFGTAGSESMFSLEAVEESLRVGAPVIAPEGLVGVVREAGLGGAVGMDWTHRDFRASAMTADGSTYGIVEPRSGDAGEPDRLVLTGTPFYTELEEGTPIVTSGRGGVYPRGIPIGSVAGVAEAEGGWRKTYWVTPAVELGSVTHVLVGVDATGYAPAPGAERPDSGSPAAARDGAAPAEEERPRGAGVDGGVGSVAGDEAPPAGNAVDAPRPPP